MKPRKVKYTIRYLSLLRHKYNVNTIIDNMVKDLPHYEFEMLRLQLLDEVTELRNLEEK